MDYFGIGVDIWIAAMLTTQSWILWKLLPEIKKMSKNSSSLGRILGLGDKANG